MLAVTYYHLKQKQKHWFVDAFVIVLDVNRLPLTTLIKRIILFDSFDFQIVELWEVFKGPSSMYNSFRYLKI